MNQKITFKTLIWKYLFSAVILIVASGFFMDDALYFFQSRTPIDLGNALSLNQENLKKVTSGDFVRITGIRSLQGGVIHKPFVNTRYMLYYFLGSPQFVIKQEMPSEKDKAQGDEGVAQVTVEGRILPFSSNSSAKRVADFFAVNYRIEMSPDGYYIEAGTTPGSMWYAFLLELFFISMLVLLIILVIKAKNRDKIRKNEGFI